MPLSSFRAFSAFSRPFVRATHSASTMASTGKIKAASWQNITPPSSADILTRPLLYKSLPPHCDFRPIGDRKVDSAQAPVRRVSRYVWIFHLGSVPIATRRGGRGEGWNELALQLCSHVREIETTRSPRPGEQDGREYNFVTKDAFLDLVAKNGFIEHGGLHC